MILDRTRDELGWPDADALFEPVGVAAQVVVSEAREKIERALRRCLGGDGVRVGVLPTMDEDTEAPLAVVCDFSAPAPESVLLEAHRLAWNYSRSNLLVTAEPGQVRAWTCSERPAVDRDGSPLPGAPRKPLSKLVVAEARQSDPSWGAGDGAALHWAELVTGQLFQRNGERFRETQRAHVTLLQNLREVRRRLRDLRLDDRHTHDLLARLIFVQFLFDRQDPAGRAALDADRLRGYYVAGVLNAEHGTLAEVLRSPDDTYALFAKLDEYFHGDLFDPEVREFERGAVKPEHLELLAHFVRGDAQFASGQLALWRSYAFDVIPLDLLSSVYETFVDKSKGTGIHYTPTHVADYVLDRVLPWDSEDWNVRVLDPACGSGIFLVKAFQRLVHRWRRAHPDRAAPRVPDLRQLLENNIVGVDRDAEAVRVAAFSLYLAMCDEIEPRDLINERGIFPTLRGRTLLPVDFFDEEDGIRAGDLVAGVRTGSDAGRYDLVVGNPPFGRDTATQPAKEWAARNGWPTSYGDVGTLFIAKAGALAREGARVAFIQSAPALLYNTTGPARKIRRRVFAGSFQVEAVTVLPPRLILFKRVMMPTCVVVLRNVPADGSPFLYECLKRQWRGQVELDDKIRFAHDPDAVHWLRPDEVIDDPEIWSVFAWGGSRDHALIQRLRQFESLGDLKERGDVVSRQGLNRGNRKRKQDVLASYRHLEGAEFPEGQGLVLDARRLPHVGDVGIDDRASTDLRAFALPQLLVKSSWVQDAIGFEARRVIEEPVISEKTFVSVSGPDDVLSSAAVVYNSHLASYYLFLTSGRFAFDRSEPTVSDLLSVPIPLSPNLSLNELQSDQDLQRLAFELFGLTEAERVLVEDLVTYTLDDYRGSKDVLPGRQPTDRGDSGSEPHLIAYSKAFARVVEAAYGAEGRVRMDVLAEDGTPLPVRFVRFTVGPKVEPFREARTVSSPELRKLLAEAYHASRETGSATSRIARIYETVDVEGEPHLAVTLVKPDEIRYWTRLAGIRDADRFTADIALWAAGRHGEMVS